MPPAATPAPSPALLAVVNAVPSVLWSVVGFGPLAVFCYQQMARPWVYGLAAVSLLAYAMPTSWFGTWQLGRTPDRYRRLGVAFAGSLVQNGALVNRWLRRRYPHYRRVPSRAKVAALVRSTYEQERFHLGAGGFFLGSSAYALAHGYVGWAVGLTLLNVAYNVYPIWLQQYIRVRLAVGSRHAR